MIISGKSEDHKDKPAFSVSVKTKLATAEKQPYTKSLFDHKSDIAQNDKKNKHQQENMSPSPPVTNKSIRSSVATSSSNSATSSQGQIFSRRWNVQAMRVKSQFCTTGKFLLIAKNFVSTSLVVFSMRFLA